MDVEDLHKNAIIIDAACPLLMERKHIELYRAGGTTVASPTVNGGDSASRALRDIGRWLSDISVRDDLLLVRHAADVLLAKSSGKLGVVFHFQGTEPIEDDLDLIDAYKQAGVGVIQLTYNTKNRVGDGCEERTDSGLSRFGIK